MINPPDGVAGRPRYLPVAALLCAGMLFAALGAWQVHRLAWKEALIARVTANTNAAPVPLAALSGDAASLEYRRVRAAGHYLPATTTLATATSELGNGYWDMVVLASDEAPVWINRGFVPLGSKRAAVAEATPTATVAIIGLARPSEPRGTFLRANHPQADRWYARDLASMAATRHTVARPDLFIDAQSETPAPHAGPKSLMATTPISGLTVLSFPNNHLSYAITWFTLCLLSIGLAFWLARQRR